MTIELIPLSQNVPTPTTLSLASSCFHGAIERCFVHLTGSLVHLTGRVDALLLLAAHSTHASPHQRVKKVEIIAPRKQELDLGTISADIICQLNLSP